MTTTITYASRENYLIFRANIESLFAHVPREHYDEILIVDDCSTDQKLISFLKYLDTFDFIRVIFAGDPTSQSFYNEKGNGHRDINKGQLSVGHGESQNISIKNTRTDNIFFADSDVLWMKKSKDLLPHLEKCLNEDENVLSAGQLVGNINGPQIIEKPYSLNGHPDLLINKRGGWPVHICVMNKIDTWKKHGLPKMVNGGWTNERHMPEFWRRGFKTSNFNVFKDGYMIHLGYATLRESRKLLHRGFVYADGGWDVAQQRGWWYGYEKIPFTTDEFNSMLKKEYWNLPFETRHNIVNWEK